MKNYYPIFLFALSFLFIQCDETRNTFVTPLRDYEEQRTADNDSIVSFLQSHYYNYDDYANAASTEHVEFTIDSLTNDPSKTPMIDQVVEQEVKIKDDDGKIEQIKTDIILSFFGLIMKLGPITELGINMEKKHNSVNSDIYL